MTKLILDRRRVLAAAGGMALFAGLDRHGRAWAAPRFSEDPFSLGVAAGDPAPDGFVIWTRLAPQPLAEHGGMPMLGVPVRWEVAEDERFERVVRAGEAVARPELSHSVHVEVEGLKPRRPYWYRFLVEGADGSPVGMARTAPAAGDLPDRVRLAVAGCQHYESGWYGAYRHLSQEADLDAVFHYGDYIYEGGARSGDPLVRDAAGQLVERRHVGGEIYSLDDYRRRYALYKSDPDLKAAHEAAAFVISFDDHEVDNDWASAFDQDGTPPEIFALRRFAAFQAWYENMPVRRAQWPRADGVTAYRRLDYGRLLRMHVLDTRSYRTDQLCTRPNQKNCRAEDGPDSTILGAAQESWLADGLTGAARWNLLAQQVWVMPLRLREPDNGPFYQNADKWDGYPAARARLVQAITERNLTNVVVASGDAHIHLAGTVPLRDDEPDGPAAATEFLSSSIASGGDGAADSPVAQRYLDGQNPNLALANFQRGYQTFDITPDEWRTDVKVMDQVQAPGGRLSTLASFTVTPDRPQLHRA